MKRPLHLIFLALICISLVVGQNGTVPVHVGVVLDLETTEGKRSLTSISMAVDDFYAAHANYSTRMMLHPKDSNDSIIAAADAALELLQNLQVQAIIGPPKSAQAEFLLALADQAHVPVLSFSVTTPSLSAARIPYFVRTTLNDSSQVGAIAAIVKSFGWRNVVAVYDDTDYGTGIVPYLMDALHKVDAAIPYRSVVPSAATDEQIEKELYRLMTLQTRVFVIHMLSDLGARLFRKAKEVGAMTEGYVWIATDGITNNLDLLEPKIIESMDGVMGVRLYMNKSERILDFTTRFIKRFHLENASVKKTVEPTVFDLWAYDTAWAVAMAVETAGVRPRVRSAPPRSNATSANLIHLDVAVAGPSLLKAILKTRFRGLCGEFRLVHGQLPTPAFEIVNVIGKGERVVGYWKPKSGVVRQPQSNEKTGLRPIIWPGDSIAVPKGWQIPTNGNRLRIGVPETAGFKRFVAVERDPSKNSTSVKGYCIDVFDAVMKSLPYAVVYDYIPFHPRTATYYDDLVYQVYLKKFDAVVGDITIIANRSQYVDFTLPYTESGVSMVVALKKKSGGALIFFKPLSADLWVTCIIFMFLTGIVVWLFEHRNNSDEFGGTLYRQLGAIVCFVCSTLVSSPDKRLKSMASHIVVLTWAFLVLILNSSYTAMLSSMLTVQELQPTATDMNELQKSGACVGYQDGSFVAELLEEMNFDRNNIRKYSTTDEYAEALSKGSDNGGVAAIFDEIPYLQVFLSKHCNDYYAMVGPTHQTAGFGFVFQKGSPLVTDVSRAILNVTQGQKMVEIKRKWMGDQMTCSSQNNNNNLSSMRLNSGSFWGLFLISGLTSISALVYFIYKNLDEVKEAIDFLWKRTILLSSMHMWMFSYFKSSRWMEAKNVEVNEASY